MGEVKEKSDKLHLKVANYHATHKEFKRLETIRKKMNGELKKEFQNTPGDYKVGNFKVKIVEQDRSTMDEEAVVKLLLAKGLTGALKTIITYNEEELESALNRGEITKEELQGCIIPNPVLALSVVPSKD